MNVWNANCKCHNAVIISQKTKPATCKVKVSHGARSTRLCGEPLTAQCLVRVAEPTQSSPAAIDLSQAASHELTFEQFASQAIVEQLVNHGRRWNVTLTGRDACFSDAETQELALRDAHSSAINNALYFNLPDSPSIGKKPSIPSAEVLAQYPDVVARFPELGLSALCAKKVPSAGAQLSMQL
ncbi:hypothetical protein ACI77O_12595 [Pseudomonas tritici]|uniref:hypothetical protein n=1 Tax=Pseudomonas tritici TaxID=2745518 RepID=UPI00387B44D7